MDTTECLFYLPFPREDCDALLADGAEDSFVVQSGESVDWQELDSWLNLRSDWVFGWMGYDVRRSIERFSGEQLETSPFPQIVLFRPKNLFKIRNTSVEVLKGAWRNELENLISREIVVPSESIALSPVISFNTYVDNVKNLQAEIAAGNVYELNYCIPFRVKSLLKDPINTWKRIYSQTEAPFSAYAQFGGYHVLCASPERYLKRVGNRVLSQPIKGTMRRGSNKEEDDRLKHELAESKKERAENVMIVDLIRNDLSRCAERETVGVDELFGVHTFKTVHHLISTIRCEVPKDTRWIDLIRATFPMGSMTGAPKLSAMKLISGHETTERGIYSGTIGYIEPSGDFDFNVVIRSVQYDKAQQQVSCHVGGAITALCNPEAEYGECMLKLEAILKALHG